MDQASSSRQKLNGLRKAAVLMVLLGDKVASAIYRSLSQEDVETLTKEIAQLGDVSYETAIQVLEEYNKQALTQEYLAKGGAPYAEKLLLAAFGERAAKELLEQAAQSGAARTVDLGTLQKSDPQQLAKFVQAEHPQTIALILAHMESKVAASLLVRLPEKLRAQVVERLAKMREFSPDTVQKVSMVLHKKVEALGNLQHRLAYGGTDAVADLLNRMDPTSSKTILESIEQNDANLALAIRNSMFTFEDLLGIPDSGLRELLGRVDKKKLATAMKGASENLKNQIFKTMSSRAAQMLKEDMEVLGPIRAREVAAAQQEIVALARQLEAEGKLMLKSEGEDAYVV